MKDNNYNFQGNKLNDNINKRLDKEHTQINNGLKDMHLEDENILSKEYNEDILIKHKIEEEMKNVKMAYALKESIRKNTINKKKNLLGKFSELMNKTIEIPVTGVCAVCFAMCLSSLLPTFIVTDTMKQNKEIQGYTSITVQNINGCNVIFQKSLEEMKCNEKN